MKKLLGVDTWYLNSQKKLKNLMNHYKNNKVLTDLVSGNNKVKIQGYFTATLDKIYNKILI